MSVFHNLSVKEVKRETKNAVSVVFNIPENLRDEFNFLPGQYITLQVNLEGKKVRRAYSICSSEKSNEIRVAIKAVENGSFSVYANTKLKVGDIIEVADPEGRFVLRTSGSNNKDYIAFVAGSGITPVMSMIKSVIETEKNSRFKLVYGNKSSEDTLFKNDLDQLTNEYKNQLEVNYIYSQKLGSNAGFGRINQDVVHDLLKSRYKDISFDEYFLCGPENMIDLVKENLLSYGAKSNQIKFELFTSPSASKELTKDLTGDTKITVVLDDEETTFDMRKDEFVLDAALLKGLDAPYSCQGGICSSCLAKVIEGEVMMDSNSILDEDEVKEGLILTCQSHPLTPILKIDYDDV